MRSCENYFCLYNQDSTCTKEHICIDLLGRCDTCVLIELSESQLAPIKKIQALQVEQALLEFAKHQKEYEK